MSAIGKCVFFQLFILFPLGILAATNTSGINIPWHYTGNKGPARWAELSSEFVLCATGKLQSPININKKIGHAKNQLSAHYQAAPMQIVNDGTTSLLLGSTQTLIKDGHSLQLNFAKDGPKETIEFANQSFRLVQFHVHTPSENEWHHQRFPMEIHFVHQGPAGQLTILSVFVKTGAENRMLQKIIAHLPAKKAEVENVLDERIDPMQLLPQQLNYYSFMGSLTTPPCSEGVQWIVLVNTITASPAQILKLRQTVNGANARPTQALNKRKIKLTGTQSIAR